MFESLKASGWIISPAVEGFPDTGCSIEGLVDSSETGGDFPEEPAAHGYNAADAFLVVAERPDQPPIFTPEEVEVICQLMENLGEMVFGHPISLQEE